jgi:hypothetical protein
MVPLFENIFFYYMVLGLFSMLFYSPLSIAIYKVALILTENLRLDQFFLYKVDKKNKDYLLSLAKKFTLGLGAILTAISIAYIYTL